MARSDRHTADRLQKTDRDADGAIHALDAQALEARALEARAETLHSLCQLRKRHFATPALHDGGMAVMLSLLIAECRSFDVGEQSVLLANDMPPLEGGATIDTLVQAGLVVVTGTMPGRRSVGLTPLGSARMRAYIAGFPGPV